MKKIMAIVFLLLMFPLSLPAIYADGTGGTPLSYGQTVSGTISHQHAFDDWVFSGQAGDVISIRMYNSSGTLDPLLKLLDSHYRIIAENDDYNGKDSAIVTYTLPYAGEFIIQAGRYGKTTGTYNLQLVQGALPNNLVALPASKLLMVGSIIYEQSRQGTLDFTYPFQTWTFFGNAGDTITASMTADTGSSLDSVLYLYSPSGEFLAYNDDSGGGLNAQLAYNLPVSGTYSLTASSYKLQSSGTYWISLSRESSGIVTGTGEAVLTEPPRNSNLLGEFQVEWYCNTQGYGVDLINSNQDWACTYESTGQTAFTLEQTHFNDICQRTYSDSGAFAVRDGTNSTVAYNWRCYTFSAVAGSVTSSQPATPSGYIGTLTPRYGVEVNVRSGPGTGYEVLGVIDWRDEYPLKGETGTWYIIDYNGYDGYVSQRWATVTYN